MLSNFDFFWAHTGISSKRGSIVTIVRFPPWLSFRLSRLWCSFLVFALLYSSLMCFFVSYFLFLLLFNHLFYQIFLCLPQSFLHSACSYFPLSFYNVEVILFFVHETFVEFLIGAVYTWTCKLIIVLLSVYVVTDCAKILTRNFVIDI